MRFTPARLAGCLAGLLVLAPGFVPHSLSAPKQHLIWNDRDRAVPGITGFKKLGASAWDVNPKDHMRPALPEPGPGAAAKLELARPAPGGTGSWL